MKAILKPELEIEMKRFTADLDWDKDGNLHAVEIPGAKKYVGEPSPEIDANWEALIPGESHRESLSCWKGLSIR